jgi:hypothetical protein
MEEDEEQQGVRKDKAGRVAIQKHRRLSPLEEHELSRLFYTPRTGFMNTYKLSKKARFYPSLSQVNTAQIKDWYWRQPVNQVYKQEAKPKVWTSIRGDGPGTNLQMDFLIYRDHNYNGYQYILCIIDVYSRKAWAYPTTNRKAPTYTRLFREFVEKELHGVWPKHLNCDNEYIEKSFAAMLSEHKTTVHYSEVGESNKNSLVERFIRTLRSMLAKASWQLNKPDWPALLPGLVQSYNETYHRTIRERPDLVFNGGRPSRQVLKYRPYDLAPGDRVRLVIKKKIFDKGDRTRLSKEVYLLDRKEGGKWILKNEQTGKVFEGQGVKPKDLRKVNEVWTTERKEVEKQKEDEEEQRKEAEAEPAPLNEEMAEEKEKQERESGVDTGPDEPRLQREEVLPSELQKQKTKVRRERKVQGELRKIADHNSAGVKEEKPVTGKRNRTPSRLNRDLGYKEPLRKKRK